jgi:curli biogenesis system outer membrane secretion channel CsgG
MNSSFRFPLLLTLLLGATQIVPFAQGQAPAPKKPTLSVAKCESQLPNWQPAISQGLADMMITELNKLPQVQVLESVALDDLRQERALGENGEVSQAESVKKGNWKGADYTFKTTITRFGSKETSFGGGGLNLPVPGGFGKFKVNNRENEVQIDWRLIDNSTRVIIKSDRSVGLEKGGGFSFGAIGDSGFSQSREFLDSALGKATMKAIAQIVEQLNTWTPPAKSGRDEVAEAAAAASAKHDVAAAAEKRKVKGEVLLVEPGKVMVSLGAQQGIQKGDKVKIYRAVEKKNKAGKVIATEYEAVAEVEINKVQKDRSWGTYAGAAKVEEGFAAAHASVDIDDLN